MFFFPVHPDVAGKFKSDPFENQTQIIDSYFSKIHNTPCSHEFLGRDDQHVFIKMNCGSEKRFFSRASYNSQYEITDHLMPADGSMYRSSLVRMFPEVVFKKLENNLAP